MEMQMKRVIMIRKQQAIIRKTIQTSVNTLDDVIDRKCWKGCGYNWTEV